MKTTFLEFEQPIAELEAKIDELRYVQDDSALDISEEIARLQKKSQALTKEVYGKLNAWQIAQVARHPQRPYTLDYIQNLFTGFEELHGDRAFADDAAIVGGLARFNGQSVMVIGHQKGRDTKDKIYRNFGMPKPEGYRKALRLMKLAGSRLTKDGVIVILAQQYRDQTRNRADARERLSDLIRQAAVKPVVRRATKVPRAQKKKRVEGKKHRGQIKAMRGGKAGLD